MGLDLGVLQVDEVERQRHLQTKKREPRTGCGEPRGYRRPHRKEERKPEDAIDIREDENLRRDPHDQPTGDEAGKAEKLRLDRVANRTQPSNDTGKHGGGADAGPVERVEEYVTNCSRQAS